MEDIVEYKDKKYIATKGNCEECDLYDDCFEEKPLLINKFRCVTNMKYNEIDLNKNK